MRVNLHFLGGTLMSARGWPGVKRITVALFVALLAVAPARAEGKKRAGRAGPVTAGQRVFCCGHSFHVFVPPILKDMAEGAGIKGHVTVGMSAIGGSRVIQHWD